MKVLIAYFTKTHTTLEAAGEIAAILRQANHETDIVPISSAPPVSDYDAVIIGAPINGMSWHPEATKFVEDNREILEGKPVAYYFMSYMLYTGRAFWKKLIRKSLDKVSAAVPPISTGMFSGKVETPLPTPARWLFGVSKQTPADVTDAETVRIWARELAAKLTYR